MNFLIKSIVFIFSIIFIFGLILIYSRWGKPPVNHSQFKDKIKKSLKNNENHYMEIMRFKSEVNNEIEEEWKKVAKLKIVRQLENK